MTREELYEMVYKTPLAESLEIEEWLNKFFEQNVVIPKGENRHPYADVLHEALEGKAIQEFQYGEWCDVLISDGINPSEYRIKQKEPVYEYQYAIVTSVSGNARLERMTQNEALSKYGNNAYKIEETKRERK